jgi:hypothetical protein
MNPEDIKAAIAALTEGNGEAALEILESLLVSAAGTGAPDAGTPPAAAGATAGNAEEPPKEAPELAALARGVLALFSGLDAASALKAVEALKLGSDKQAADAAVLECVERRALVGELVKLGVEVPATAWIDPDKTGADLVPVDRLVKEALPALRKRVSIIKSTRGAAPRILPPTRSEGGPAPRKLSRAELAYCEKHKITPEQFQARTRDAVRSSR